MLKQKNKWNHINILLHLHNMKTNFYQRIIIFCSVIIINHVAGQVPLAIPYQAVARNSAGVLLASQNISLRISLHDANARGTVVYSEIHNTNTNTAGLFTVKVGYGSPVTGNFSAIDWGTNSKFLQVEMDALGGSSYLDMGTQQMLSVAYALYANKTKSLPEGTGNGNTLRWNGAAWEEDNTITSNINSNYVGIGTNNPGSKLDVNGDALINGLTVGRGYSNINTNVVVGILALPNNNTGSNIIAIGSRALYRNSTGNMNIAIGSNSLSENTSGNENTAIGTTALQFNTTGFDNVAIGLNALYNNTTGNYNTAIGSQSLTNISGNYNTGLGYGVTQTGNYSNSTALGHTAALTASNQVRIGNSDVTSIGGQVGWSTLSDGRFKTDISESVPGLNFINKLHPVTYHLSIDKLAIFLNTPDSMRTKESENVRSKLLQTGFIAQDVEKAANEIGFDFSGVDAPKNEQDLYGLRYAEFVVPLVKAVQELNAKLESVLDENAQLKKQIEKINAHLGMEFRAEK